MYTYKFVDIKHSVWTGKAKERVEDVIAYYAERGWRMKQILMDNSGVWYGRCIKTKVIFEKELEAEEFETLRVPVYQEEFV